MFVRDMGEKRLVWRITEKLYRNENVIIGAGEDDAAVVNAHGKLVVLKSDMVIESSHFPKTIGGYYVGRKVTIANLSDIAAMGAEPLAFLASFGLPENYNVEKVDEIVKGINETCKEYKTPFVGGDTKKTKELVISGAAFGVVEKDEVLRRKNAKPGDVVAVTGSIGNAVLGLEILLRKVGGRKNKKFVDAFLMPKARIKEGGVIAKSRVGAAAMDISDGFLYTACEIAKISGVRIDLEREKIPISKDAIRLCGEIGMSYNQLLNGGEDYELLVTIEKSKFEEIKSKIEKIGGRLIEIGRARNGHGVRLDGKAVEARGYDAFLGKDF
jgi:thiamine-monophosphate kinase